MWAGPEESHDRLQSDRKMKQQQEIFHMAASVCVCVSSLFHLKQGDVCARSTVDCLVLIVDTFERGNEFVGTRSQNRPKKSNHNKAFGLRRGSLELEESETASNISSAVPQFGAGSAETFRFPLVLPQRPEHVPDSSFCFRSNEFGKKHKR